jgi:hypothetical protein
MIVFTVLYLDRSVDAKSMLNQMTAHGRYASVITGATADITSGLILDLEYSTQLQPPTFQ